MQDPNQIPQQPSASRPADAVGELIPGPQSTLPNLPNAASNAQPIFSGSVSLWMAASSFILGFVVDLIGAGLLVYWGVSGPTPLGIAAMIGGFAMIAASSLMLLYTVISIRASRYTITHRHIERELGLFVKKVDALPLGNVKRVDLKQSFIERVINVGTIEVYDSDDEQAHPHWKLEGINDPRPTYEKLRDAVMDLTMRRGIIIN